MSSYLAPLPSNVQPLEQHTPDFGFLAKVLGTKQAQYDQGFNQVKTMYSSLLNSPVSSTDNENYRKELFKKIETQIKGVSTLDLAKPQSVTKANSIFDPIINDKELTRDMALTRSYQNALSEADAYATSADSNTRAKYSDVAKNYILNGLDELQNAKRGDGSIMRAQKRDFVPFEDTFKYLQDEAAKQKLEIKQSASQGLYIVTTTGGPTTAPAFSKWAQETLGNRFDQQFHVEAVVGRENAVRGLVQQGYSKTEALHKVANDMLLPKIIASKKASHEDASGTLKTIESQIAQMKRTFPNGIPQTKAEEFQKLLKSRTAHDEFVKTSGKDLDFMSNSTPEQIAANIDYYNTAALKANKAFSWGKNYAMTTFKQDVKADEVGLTFVRQAHAEKMENIKWERDKMKMLQERAWEVEDYEMGYKGNQTSSDGTSSGVSGKRIEKIGSYHNPDQSGSAVDVLNTHRDQNFNDLFRSSLGANGGLLDYVLDSPTEAAKYSGVLNKLHKQASGETVQFSQEDKDLMLKLKKDLGVSGGNMYLSNGSTPDHAKAAIYELSESVIGRLEKKSKTDPSGQTMNNLLKNFPAMNKAVASVAGLTQQEHRIQDQDRKIAELILNADGSIKEQFEGVKFKGNHRGIPTFDWSETSKENKELIANSISREYTDQAAQSGSVYKVRRPSASLLYGSMNPNNIERIRINGADVSEGDYAKYLPQLNEKDLRTSYGDEVDVKVDPSTGKVILEYKSTVGKDGEATQAVPRTMEIVMDYNKFQSISEESKKITGGKPQFATSALYALSTGKVNSAKGEIPYSAIGLDYEVTWGTDANTGREGVIVSGTGDYGNGTKQDIYRFVPVKDRSPQELKAIEESLLFLISNFAETRANLEKTAIKDVPLIPYSNFDIH